MSRSGRQGFVDRVEQKVWSLRQSGLTDRHLRLGVLATLEQNLPLRDAIVLREARRFAAADTARAGLAWERARAAIKRSLPESTWAIWIAPIEVLGEDGELLLLAAPTRVRPWAERRYMALIRAAVEQHTDFAGARMAAITLPEPQRPKVVA